MKAKPTSVKSRKAKERPLNFNDLCNNLSKITTDNPLLELNMKNSWAIEQRNHPIYLFKISLKRNKNFNEVRAVDGNRNKCRISKEDLQDFCQALKDKYQTKNYRKVTTSDTWRNWFHVSNVKFKHRIGASTKIITKQSLCCKRCGIYLPIEYMTVDHQAPQKNGGNLAIIRVFRHLGYTVGGPIGRKADKSVFTLPGSQTERYQLSTEGCLLYSCFVYGDALGTLRNYCMNSIYNLDAMCGSCNSGKSNIFKGVQLPYLP